MARLPRGEADEALPAAEWRRRASYLPPEQVARGYRGLTWATDLYGLGVILYTILTGQPPFVGSTLAEVLEQIRSQEPEPPRRRQPAIPLELEALCLQCLAKRPADRPASAEALAEELERISAGEE
jgi:serine/threonine-protein kinase